MSVVRQENTARLAVQDFGQGMEKEQLKHIFEPFYRAPEAQSSKKSGWGLGLVICKDIVERHGGRIWCESREGEGSTFYVELPLLLSLMTRTSRVRAQSKYDCLLFL